MKTDVMVYVGILAIAGVQISSPTTVPALSGCWSWRRFRHFSRSCSSCTCGMRNRRLRLALIPATLFVLVMMNMIWADSLSPDPVLKPFREISGDEIWQHFRRCKFVRRAKVALTGALILAANAACYAQSCALCYTQAAGSGHRFIQGLQTGILVLIVPPMFMSVGITVLAYRKRNRTNDNRESDKSENDW